MAATTIDQVLADLNAIIDWSLAQPSRIGYFASLYYGVTADIKSKIGTGFFNNDALVEQLDVTFANRYLDAVTTFQNGGTLPAGWSVAMQATGNSQYIILQQLLVAMNPHINIDLGVACAQVAPTNLPALHPDFLKVNAILDSMIPIVQNEIGSISPWMKVLFKVGGVVEDDVLNWSMGEARDFAWDLANMLAPMNAPQQQAYIDKMNVVIAQLGHDILDPGELLGALVNLVWSRENHDIVTIIHTLDPTP
ncbi:MAG TPA: DUF5995 family protein [Fimbriimonadaceae bacterium]|nr:DUF5995 family protein [Fimbriimonadaceae bacterium]